MDCPQCRTALVMSERQGIEIDYCPKCRGIWLDRGELDKIIERSNAYTSQPSDSYGHDQRRPLPPQQQHHPHEYKRKKSFWEEIFD